MANEFDNVESKIGQAGDAVTNNNHLVSEAYTGMESFKGIQQRGAQSSETIDNTFGQLTLTGVDQGQTGRRRAGQQPAPSPLDISPEAEARRREAEVRRIQEWLQRYGDRRGNLHPH